MPARVAVSWCKPGYHRAVLSACARRLDGRPAAAATTRRKCAVLVNPLGYALERRLLPGRARAARTPRLGFQRTVVSRETVVAGRQTVGRDR
jgi:hypothetical protein